ncbi:MAG: ATP-dependent Clp protease ATP-binding subunit [Clostridia bacterium]|nr:ATP-dependent Clp protease ATP-binding subunit [Clostridia bacterium]
MAALCAKCKKNQAVLFVSRMENGEMKSEGYCLKCAKELGLKPIDDVLNNLGLREEDLDAICEQANEVLGGELMNVDDDTNNIGETGTDSILRRLYGNLFPGAARRDNREQKGNGQASAGQTRQQRRSAERQEPEKKYLNAFCIDLTAKAASGKMDGLIGRETELQRTMQILNRRLKNNPCLIGEPGVGKTAIVEGLAQRIVQKKAPYKLLDKEIWQLDMTSLVAGTQYRGQMEGRMKGLLDEIKSLGNIILFIDEVHSIVGAGDAEGGMNAANILKPALSRGDIQVIGATTFTEYRKHIEKDTALERRFQPVTVEEPSIEDSIAIVSGVAHYYEAYHSVVIPKAMARQAVLLSERYITDRFLPDKAIDLLDEAAADLNLKSPICREMESIHQEMNALKAEASSLLMGEVSPETEERLAAIKESTDVLDGRLQELTEQGLPTMTVDSLAGIIELWTKIPAGKIREQEFTRLAALSDRLKGRIVGQDQAVDAVCAAIKRRRAGISDSRRPISFLFIGPTGVGKTELVKQLSRELFDGPEALVRLDMSEFMEKHAVSRIIGSPPGYVGYDEAGQLTETVRRRPYCVILFDEIEKAHPDVMNILLQILDDGHITDAHGRKVNFANTVLIMTSNAGSEEKGSGTVGFSRSSMESTKEKAMNALKSFLRPEFLNRLDDIICFSHLSQESMTGIAHILLKELKASMANKGLSLTWSDAAARHLALSSYSQAFGARNLRRYIETEVEDKIVDLLMSSQGQISHISVGCRNDKLTVQGK